jgi:hypothetical protein
MTTIPDIYEGAERLINDILRKEIIAQGHHLTGAMEESLSAETSTKGNTEIMEGFAAFYSQFVNDGFPAQSASFKQYPFLLEYFIKRGYPVFSTSGNITAGQLAAATIHKWMKEGMPTQASKRFSETGSRTNMIENAFAGNSDKIDEYIGNGLDFMVEEEFQLEKSETI